MFLRKIRKVKLVWGVNLLLFAGLVFLGIEQAGRGAEISSLENKIEASNNIRRELSERIFKFGEEDKIAEVGTNLGYTKPTKVLYFNSEDISLTLR